jgi:mRNA-degrading endonuclease RelE of RelBE toxin-antitoxin system
MSRGDWRWQFRAPAKRTYDDLDDHAQKRITDKLDEIVTDQWRDPDDYLEPLTGAPHSKLRIGQFRLGAECNHTERILDIDTSISPDRDRVQCRRGSVGSVYIPRVLRRPCSPTSPSSGSTPTW